MGQPYVGEIRLFGGNFPPSGWMTCDGQTLAISEYDTLFNLIGTTYGGDGQSTFNLPNLSGRVPIHMGSNGTSTYTLAENGGVSSVTLGVTQMPAHSHTVVADANPTSTTSGSPSNAAYGNAGATKVYSAATHAANLKAMSTPLQNAGGSQPHENLQPYQAVTFIISLFGVFPSQT